KLNGIAKFPLPLPPCHLLPPDVDVDVRQADRLSAVRFPVQVPLAVAVPNWVEVHPVRALRANAGDDAPALLGDAAGEERLQAPSVGGRVAEGHAMPPPSPPAACRSFRSGAAPAARTPAAPSPSPPAAPPTLPLSLSLIAVPPQHLRTGAPRTPRRAAK